MKQNAPSKASGTRAIDLAEKKKGEIFAFLWATFALLLFLCLWSYHPSDTNFEVSTPNYPIKNYAGITGAMVAWSLNFVFGKASYFFVVLCSFWALSSWSCARRQSISLKLFSGTIFFVSSCAMLALMFGADQRVQFQQGGLIGFFLAHLLTELFGRAALYMAVTMFFLSVLLATEFLVLPILFALFRGVRHAMQRLTESFAKQAALAPKPQAQNQKRESIVEKEAAKLKISLAPSADTRLPDARSKSDKDAKIPAKRPDLLQQMLSKDKPVVPAPPLIKTILPMKPAGVTRDSAVSQPPKPKPIDTPLGEYRLPPLDLLREPLHNASLATKDEIDIEAKLLEQTLADFDIEARVVEVEQGPAITRFELQPASGVKVQRISALADNISLAMRATSVRIIAPIPGKSGSASRSPTAPRRS